VVLLLLKRRWLFAALGISLVSGMMGCRSAVRVPDLPLVTAADLVSQTPEFNRYARLVKVEDVFHAKDSMESVSYGHFTFQYLNSPSNAIPIKANADFRFWDGTWRLNGFDYGCPSDCHFVEVHKDLPKQD
jgi:hypothetical protein